MKILIIGDESNLSEAQKKFGGRHDYSHSPDHQLGKPNLATCEVVFDFKIEEDQKAVSIYDSYSGMVFLHACKISLTEILRSDRRHFKATFFGFNGLPTMLDRSVLEVSVFNVTDREALRKLCENLGTQFLEVDDRVGMVTPRVIAMIINEAYFTVQEGTASREDIDLAMKLGTNYPFGPFEWCSRIGIRHIYELLLSIYEDTKDERYKICPLLKKEYLKNKLA
jgi:3-hydroxybutyryl-CoA dehydrogenase